MNEIHLLDSRTPEAYGLLSTAGQPIRCVCTDPPFGMDVQMNSATTPEGKAKNRKIEGDETIEDALDRFDAALSMTHDLWHDEFEMYVFTAWHTEAEWLVHLRELGADLGFEVKMQLIWDKGYPGKGDLEGNWGCGYEVIFYCKRGRRKLPYRRSGILHFDKIPSGQNIHPTEKPPELLMKLIEMSTDPGELVVDFFSGSGSTSVAAQRLGRQSIAFEIDPIYVEKSRNRLTQPGFNI